MPFGKLPKERTCFSLLDCLNPVLVKLKNTRSREQTNQGHVLLWTSTCTIQWLERAGYFYEEFTLFNAFWFATVTLATVGFGDMTPTWNASKFVLIILILLALYFLPSEVKHSTNETKISKIEVHEKLAL